MRVAAELASNSLLVSAPAGKMADIRRTIELFDQPPAAAGPPPAVIVLQRARAPEVLDIVNRLIANRPGMRVWG